VALGDAGTTLSDELNRLANGGTYRVPGAMVGEALAARQWAAYRSVTLTVSDTVGVLNQIAGNFPFVHAATTAATSGVYLAGTTGADGGTGVGATLTAASNARLVVDGHTISTGERVLYWQNTDAKTNGVYYVTNEGSASTKWVLTRDTTADNHIAGQLRNGKYVYVSNGTTYGGQKFIITSNGTGPKGSIVIGTQNITFALSTSTDYNKEIWLDFTGVCNYLAGTTGLAAAAALRLISS
jgi:hypothetical protein